MRDRLIELIEKAVENSEFMYPADVDTVCIADHLLANGVIVPPCKVGQTVCVLSGDGEEDWIDEYNVKYFYCSSKGINRIYIECGTMGNNFRPKDIGKTVFLTKEEAEEKLNQVKQRSN